VPCRERERKSERERVTDMQKDKSGEQIKEKEHLSETFNRVKHEALW